MSTKFFSPEEKRRTVKDIIRRLHTGENVAELKNEFGELLASVTPTEIAQIEEELVQEGMKAEQLHKLCDLHLEIFRETVEAQRELAPAGHPINTLLEEHSRLLGFTAELRDCAAGIMKAGGFPQAREELERLGKILEQFKASQSHYIREENVLFPYLEKHGITQPPKIMWMEHDQVRALEKSLYWLLEEKGELGFQEFSKKLVEAARVLAEFLSDHFTKEGKVLFPTAMRLFTGAEWKEVLQQFDELGYCSFTPERPQFSFDEDSPEGASCQAPADTGDIPLEPGPLSQVELQGILDHLPVDISFVDAKDRVRYFNEAEERIFPRTKAIIGRTVQNCHPGKSLHVVEQILEDFRQGARKKAEFWITIEGRFIHIRYFAVHSREGEYLGCLEASQDLTELRKLEGQKRLLD